MVVPLIVGIGLALKGIYNEIKSAIEIIIHLILGFLNFVASIFQSFVQASPPIMKFWIFLFLLLSVVTPVVYTIMSLNYVCLDGELRQPDSFATGFVSFIEVSYEGITNSTTSLNGYVNNRTVPYISNNIEEDITRIECRDDRPTLTFLGIDPFSYKTWLVILLLWALIKVYLVFHK